VRDVAVVARIVHGGGHEAIDENGAAFLVDFVLDGFGMSGDFDDDVEIVGEGLAGRNVVKCHFYLSAIRFENLRL